MSKDVVVDASEPFKWLVEEERSYRDTVSIREDVMTHMSGGGRFQALNPTPVPES